MRKRNHCGGVCQKGSTSAYRPDADLRSGQIFNRVIPRQVITRQLNPNLHPLNTFERLTSSHIKSHCQIVNERTLLVLRILLDFYKEAPRKETARESRPPYVRQSLDFFIYLDLRT